MKRILIGACVLGLIAIVGIKVISFLTKEGLTKNKNFKGVITQDQDSTTIDTMVRPGPHIEDEPFEAEAHIADADQDGLPDEIERLGGTDPRNPDTDGDGFKDGEEVLKGYNPKGEGKL